MDQVKKVLSKVSPTCPPAEWGMHADHYVGAVREALIIYTEAHVKRISCSNAQI